MEQYDFMAVSRSKIENFKQNHPRYVVRDLASYGMPPEITHRSLMARGVYKWFGVRRLLIKLKNTWRDRVNETLNHLHNRDGTHTRDWYRGYLQGITECRKEVRQLCHMPRWQTLNKEYPYDDK